jgi:hypothetical protein
MSRLVLPWAYEKNLGFPDVDFSGLDVPARTYSCQRFADILANANA